MLDDVEEKNYRSIINLVNKCENDLERLQIILPKPPDKDGTFAGLRAQFARKLCEDTVKDIIMGIKLCNSVGNIGEHRRYHVNLTNNNYRPFRLKSSPSPCT